MSTMLTMERYTSTELEKFNKFWKKEWECHLWQNYLDRDWYGTFFFRHKWRRAHRVSYYMFVWDIEEWMVIDHICWKKNCVNPSHLRMITVKENNRDSRNVCWINFRKTHCKCWRQYDRFYCGQRSCSHCTKISHKKSKERMKKLAECVFC